MSVSESLATVTFWQEIVQQEIVQDSSQEFFARILTYKESWQESQQKSC